MTGPEAQPASCTLGYRVSCPEVVRPGRGVDQPLHAATVLKNEQSYTSTPPLGLHLRLCPLPDRPRGRPILLYNGYRV